MDLRKKIIDEAKKMFNDKKEIDVIELASKQGIDLIAVDTNDEYNAHIQYDDDSQKFTIYINANHPYNRVKFSVAHELGHYVLHPDLIRKHKIVARSRIDHLDPKAEKEANNFAGELLMPQELVEEELKELRLQDKYIDQDLLAKLVEIFKVSREAMQIQLTKLGYELQIA